MKLRNIPVVRAYLHIRRRARVMDCKIARQQLFGMLDYEINVETNESSSAHLHADAALEKHLAGCVSCRREYRLLSFPRAAAAVEPPVTASTWFYQRLCRRIDEEAQSRAGRQAVWRLAYRMVPALAGITLTLASIFVWQEARSPTTTPWSYEYVFIADDASLRMLADDQNDITYRSVLTALAERHIDNFPGAKHGNAD